MHTVANNGPPALTLEIINMISGRPNDSSLIHAPSRKYTMCVCEHCVYEHVCKFMDTSLLSVLFIPAIHHFLPPAHSVPTTAQLGLVTMPIKQFRPK